MARPKTDLGHVGSDTDATHLAIKTDAPRPTEALQGSAEARVEMARALAAACEEELAGKPDVGRGARLHYEVARLYEGPLEDLETAAEHYLLAHQLMSNHLPTLRGARRVLIEQGKYARALPLFDAELKLTGEPQKKAMLLYEKGLLLEDKLKQRREARQAFAAALELDEGNPSVLKALERADISSSAWDELDKTYERAANAVSSDPQHRAAILAERARLMVAKKKHPDEAIDLYQTALSIDPRAPGALHALKSLLYSHNRWRDLVAVLDLEAQLASDPNVRAMARYRIGRIYADRLGGLDEAIAALEAAAADTPGDPMVLEEIARAYELGKRWDRLVMALEHVADETASPNQRVGVLHRIGQIYEERLEKPDAALEWYRRALDSDPGYQPALQALAKLYARQEQWAALIAMHLGEAGAATDNARRAAAHARVAEIFEIRLGKAEQAIEHHGRALALVPGYAPSFKALVRLYSESNQFRELAELYERAVDLAKDDETKITYLFKIGRLHEDALGSPKSAVAAYRRILQVDANHLAAIHAVQRAAERGGEWEALLDALEYEASRTQERVEKVALLHRAGEIAEEHIGDVEKALSHYTKVTELDPRYAPALSSLGRLYYQAGRWEDLLKIYQLELAVMPKSDESAALRFKMAELSEERLGDEDRAIRWYRQAFEADPRHTPSLRALARLLSAKGEWKEVVRLLELELEAAEDDMARARVAFRAGEIYENRLGLSDKALSLYDQALKAVPDFRPASDGRARLLEQGRNYKALALAFEKEATTIADPVMAIAARMREGEIWRDHLGDARRAIEAFEAVLERDPNHLGSHLALEALYAETDQWEKLSQNYAAQARILQNGLARVAVLREQARVQELKELEDIETLTQTYLSIVRMAPSDVSALWMLERFGLLTKDWGLLTHVDAKLSALTEDPALNASYQTRLAESLEATGDASALDTYRAALARDPDNVAAARGLSRLAEGAQDPGLLAEAAQSEAKVVGDLDRGATLLVRSATVRASQGDHAGAVADLERALDLNPDHELSAQHLAERLFESGDMPRLVDVLTRAAGAATKTSRRAALWVQVGELQAERVGDLGAGLSALARATREVPKFVPALLKQAELYSRDQQWSQAASALSEVIAANPEDDVILSAELELASILHHHLGDTKRAEKNLQMVLSQDPSQRSALKLLLDI